MIEKRVSLALGGGAAKGLAHVGVLRGLEEDGVEVAAVAGTSMGSIVGALFVGGMKALEMEAFFAAVDWTRLGRIMVRSAGGTPFDDLLRETLSEVAIEKMNLPFAAVCCDLDTGEEVVLRSGDLADAVRASSAIPGILPPLIRDGRTLVDGAMVTPVPVIPAASLAEAPVLAVNVLRPPKPGQAAKPVVHRLLEGSAPAQILERMDEILRRHRIRLRDRQAQFPNRLEVLMRSFHIMQYNLSKPCDQEVSSIEPEVGAVGWFDFDRAPEIMAEGYRGYREFVGGH
jgi:NTE family protein